MKPTMRKTKQWLFFPILISVIYLIAYLVMAIRGSIIEHHYIFLSSVLILTGLTYVIVAYFEQYKVLLSGSLLIVLVTLFDMIYHQISPHDIHTEIIVFDLITHILLVGGLITLAIGTYIALTHRDKQKQLIKMFSMFNELVYFDYNKKTDLVNIEFSSSFVKRHKLNYNTLDITYGLFVSYIHPDDCYKILDETSNEPIYDYPETEFRIKYPQMKDYTWMHSKVIKNEDTIFTTLDVDISNLHTIQNALTKTQRALYEKSSETNYIYEQTSDFIAKFDKDGKILFATKSYEQLFNLSLDEIIGKKLSDLNQSIGREKDEGWLNVLYSKRYQDETVKIDTNDGPRYINWQNQLVYNETTNEEVVLSVGHDITTIMTLTEKLEYQSTHDELTGLLNRSGLKEYVEDMDKNQHYGLFLIDLINFSSINEYYSHAFGDEVIKEIAETLKEYNKQNCQTIRMSGDEFLIVCAYSNQTHLNTLIRSLKALCSESYTVSDITLEIKKNIGYTLFDPSENTFEDALKEVDMAAVEVKNTLETSVLAYRPSMKEKLMFNVELARDIKEAIDQDSMELYIQPIYHTKSQGIVGHEVLTRFNHKTRGFIDPPLLFKIARQAGLSRALDFYLIKKALVMIKDFKALGYISLNILPETLLSKDLLYQVSQIIKTMKIDPANFVLEISENTFIHNIDDCISQIRGLKKQGVKIALDDFGKNYSSLASLDYVDFDIIKIDQVFIKKINNEKYLEVIKMVQTIANLENKTVICEGVETKEQSDTLNGLELFVQQGYFHGKPQSLNAVIQALKKN